MHERVRGLAALLMIVQAVALAVLPAGCGDGDDVPADDGRVGVVVSILPQAYFAERIGGAHVRVTPLVGPGQSPHTFQIQPRTLQTVERARIYFRIGILFEEQIVGRVGRSLDVVKTYGGIDRRRDPAAGDGHGHEDHADHAGHEHGGVDPHVWLDPKLVRDYIAPAMARALAAADPAHEVAYERNLRAFQADLTAVDEELVALLAPHKGDTIYVAHPAFGYFAASYALRQAALEFEGKDPSPNRLTHLVQRARAAGVKTIFYQEQFSKRPAERLAEEIGADAVGLDPLARDYLANLRRIGRAIDASLRKRDRDG